MVYFTLQMVTVSQKVESEFKELYIAYIVPLLWTKVILMKLLYTVEILCCILLRLFDRKFSTNLNTVMAWLNSVKLSTLFVFSGSYINIGSRVLIVSKQGRSRCSAVTIAFLMHHLKYTLEASWVHSVWFWVCFQCSE